MGQGQGLGLGPGVEAGVATDTRLHPSAPPPCQDGSGPGGSGGLATFLPILRIRAGDPVFVCFQETPQRLPNRFSTDRLRGDRRSLE